MSDEGFLSRWSRRKAQQRRGVEPPADGPVVAPAGSAVPPPLVGETQLVHVPSAAPAAVSVEAPAERPVEPPAGPPAPPPPTMDDVVTLTRDSDYSRFVAPGVDQTVQRAAMKKLFSDPHFNVMDGLDTYIDDYNKPDPIPLSMLRRLNQSKLLRLFDDDQKRHAERDDNPRSEPMQTAAQAAVPQATPEPAADDDHHADLQLQPDDDAGRSGPEPGPGA